MGKVFWGIAIAVGLVLLLWGVDVFGGHKSAVTGMVLGRSYTPMYITYMQSGKVLTPIVHPEQFYLHVRGPHGVTTIGASQADYAVIADGSQVGYSEYKGLFTGHIYSL